MQARGSDRKREVGTEHLLAGLLSTSGPAAELLRAAGLELETLRERLTEAGRRRLGPAAARRGDPPLELGEPGGGVDLGRILDASANRAREGLRVVEDYVRFVLDDPGLTRRLKEVRHRLAEAERGLDEHLLLGSRDTREDVGTHIMTPIRADPRKPASRAGGELQADRRGPAVAGGIQQAGRRLARGPLRGVALRHLHARKADDDRRGRPSGPGRRQADGLGRRSADAGRSDLGRGRGPGRRRRRDPVSRKRPSGPRAAAAEPARFAS